MGSNKNISSIAFVCGTAFLQNETRYQNRLICSVSYFRLEAEIISSIL